jgi:hypothetical protein
MHYLHANSEAQAVHIFGHHDVHKPRQLHVTHQLLTALASVNALMEWRWW